MQIEAEKFQYDIKKTVKNNQEMKHQEIIDNELRKMKEDHKKHLIMRIQVLERELKELRQSLNALNKG